MNMLSRMFSMSFSSREEDTTCSGAIVKNNVSNWSVVKFSKRIVYQYKNLKILLTISISSNHEVISMITENMVKTQTKI